MTVPPEYPTTCPGGVVRFWEFPEEPRAFDFSPDGTRLAIGGHKGLVVVARVADGLEVSRSTKHTQRIQSVRFANNGLSLAAGSEDGSLSHWNITAEPPRVWVHGGIVHAVAFSPDDMRLLVGGSGGVYLLKVPGLTGSAAFEDPRGANRAVAYLPGGLEVVVAQGERVGRIVALRALDLGFLRVIADHPEGPILRMAVSPKNPNSFLYTVGARIRVAGIVTPTATAFERHGSAVEDLRFSADGQRFASAGADRALVWNGSTYEVERTFLGPNDTVAFSPDGKYLVRRDGRRVLIHCL